MPNMFVRFDDSDACLELIILHRMSLILRAMHDGMLKCFTPMLLM